MESLPVLPSPATSRSHRFGATTVKLIIQVPCLNERETLPETIADLPRQIDGIDEIEVLVVDDGVGCGDG